jgi:ABC-type multidrug transport system fused ATPase/permease subunit
MSRNEKLGYFGLLALRSIAVFLDLLGILAIGFLATSIAVLVSNPVNPPKKIEFAGLSLPTLGQETMLLVVFVILALLVSKAAISILLTRILALFLAKIEAKAATVVARTSFGADLDQARLNTRDEIFFSVQSGSTAAFNSILNSLGTIASEGLLFAFIISSFFVFDPWSAIAALFYFGVVALVIQVLIGTQLQKSSLLVSKSSIETNQALSDLSEVLREATVLGKKEFFFRKVFDSKMNAASSVATQHTLSGMPRYIVETALVVAVTLFIVFQAMSEDLVSASATIGVFLSGGLRLTASLLPLQSAFLAIKQSIPIAERALKFLGSKNSSIPGTTKAEAINNQVFKPAKLVFKDVSFSYPNSPKTALQNIDLTIEPGTTVAFIGVSGAGKSTIADLMLGLLRPTSGRVLVDQIDPASAIEQNPGSLAYVPQKPGIVSGTIADNVALGVPRQFIDPERLEQATHTSNLTQVIRGLPGGIHTNVGNRRDELSGGQIQRIGLARALYSRPGLLILDEATSALDAESENEINKALELMSGKVTIVLIAHRLNTIRRADVVFLVESGKITASGTFNYLRENNSIVKKLAELMSF